MITCKICSKTISVKGFNGHVSSHKETISSYVEKYGEYRINSIKRNKRLEEEKYYCKICNSEHISERELTYHIQSSHNLSKQEYVLKYIFNNEIQYCQCGCGNTVKILNKHPYKRDYITGHNPNGMTGKLHNQETRQKMSSRAINRYLTNSKKETSIEIQFENFLISNNLKYEKQVKTEYGVIDFFVDDKYHIEIDGDYWHPLELKHLNLQLIQSAINDHRKNCNIRNLIRIRQSDLDSIKKWEDIFLYNSVNKYPNKVNDYRDTIISKDYFKNYICSDNTKVLQHAPSLLLSFIKTFQPNFPQYTHPENLNDVIEKISNKSDSVYNIDGNYFSNNCSNLGVGYLKQNFNSYWKSAYKGNKSPIDIWNDDKLMYDIIKYRIGLNNSNEIFDFSLHQLVRGISAIRGTISFFKPVLAAAIYKKYLGDIDSPIVLDPCAGFGGRMLGFKSMYPNGTYIGIEPNLDTYNELIKLSENFENVKLYNCKFEDFTVDREYDMIFTSIPYFDWETYSKPVQYSNISEWENTFIKSIKKLKGAVINIPESLYYLFSESTVYSHIKSNASHFSSKVNKTELLIEV